MTIFAYYFDFQALRHQLDYYQDFQVDCVADSTMFKKLVDTERGYDFLVGLNLEYVLVRIQILEKDPFPTLMQLTRIFKGRKVGGVFTFHLKIGQ